MCHAWNLVCIDSTWYYADVAYDLAHSTFELHYDNFLKTEEEFRETGHTSCDWCFYDGNIPETSTVSLSETKKISAQSCLRGDVNGDNTVNVLDVVFLYQHLIGQKQLSSAAFCRADMNADGEADIFDLALLKRVLVTS